MKERLKPLPKWERFQGRQKHEWGLGGESQVPIIKKRKISKNGAEAGI